MVFCNSVKDWFTDPNSPMYYVVGAAFLLVIIGLLAMFIVLDNKNKKKAAKKAEEKARAEAEAQKELEEREVPSESDGDKTKADENETNEVESDKREFAEPNEREEKEESPEMPENDGGIDANDPQDDEIKSKDETNEKNENKEKVETETKTDDGAAEEQISENQTSEIKTETVETAEAEKKTAKAKTKKETVKITQVMPLIAETKKPIKPKTKSKTFIDTLLAEKEVHGIYNELKNTVLSYPGMKAKLTKDEESFMFGAEKKAAFKLDGDCMALYLALKFEDAPTQLGLSKSSDAELPVMMQVKSSDIDNAQKSIVFAMNVSLLTRNASHRRVDYIKKAVDAKARAKANAKNAKNKK